MAADDEKGRINIMVEHGFVRIEFLPASGNGTPHAVLLYPNKAKALCRAMTSAIAAIEASDPQS